MIKKILLTTTTALSVLASSSLALAANVAADVENHHIVVAIQELGNKIEGLTMSGVKSVNEVAYQIDKSFTSSMQLNVKQSDIQNGANTLTQSTTDRAVKLNLLPFSAATLTYTNKSQPEVRKVNAEARAQQNFISQLKNLDASDSIYSLVQGMEISSYWAKKNLSIPGRNDDAFNFSSFIEPEAYTVEQAKNSDNFIGYVAKQYQSYTDALNLSQLRNALVQYQKQGVKTLSQQIAQFRNNDAYKNYQMTIRTLTANKSVSTDILSGLAAERKPIMTTEPDPQLEVISRAIGIEPKTVSLKDANGDSVTMHQYASPLQVAKYRANYRLKSPEWYQEVAADSAENLQRKSVVLLAEISSQLYQNHLDNEKMMGALAVLNLQSGETANLMLKAQVNDVNAAITAFAASANTSTQTDTSSSSSSSSTSSSSSNTTTSPASTDVNGTTYDTSGYTYDPNNPTAVPTTTPTN